MDRFPSWALTSGALTDDNRGEHTNWGYLKPHNPYDGKCAVRAASKDAWGGHCGGETADYGDFLSEVTAANAAIVQQMLSEATPGREGFQSG